MESKIETIETTTLVLNVEEREWLKGMMQNSMYHNETREDEVMRGKFWTALGGATQRKFEDDG